MKWNGKRMRLIFSNWIYLFRCFFLFLNLNEFSLSLSLGLSLHLSSRQEIDFIFQYLRLHKNGLTAVFHLLLINQFWREQSMNLSCASKIIDCRPKSRHFFHHPIELSIQIFREAIMHLNRTNKRMDLTSSAHQWWQERNINPLTIKPIEQKTYNGENRQYNEFLNGF